MNYRRIADYSEPAVTGPVELPIYLHGPNRDCYNLELLLPTNDDGLEPVIALALARAGARTRVADLALDVTLVDRVELDCENLLCHDSVSPLH
jgi:hypothetical protein